MGGGVQSYFSRGYQRKQTICRFVNFQTEKDSVNTAVLKSVSSLPVCVGFGISTPADVAAIAAVADGVVIGSAFEKIIEENLENPDLVSMMGDTVRRLKAATVRRK
ncbi:MAG: tryptophan synthase subunit alpha [Deltaproteobacteria bacterium]|nr:tryptophan synthase subunit alpha [Deltaproteobacteria bacterium]MBW2677562.1 tryptophan synthase subunit alpha [Deltaproteobacteria bacterium]